MSGISRGVPGVDRVVGPGETIADFDFYVPLMNLPGVFGTGLRSIPIMAPYVHAMPELIERWGRRIPDAGGKMVGISWAGSPQHVGDRHRSIPLEMLSPLGEVEGIRFISLQKGTREGDATTSAGRWLTLGWVLSWRICATRRRSSVNSTW